MRQTIKLLGLLSLLFIPLLPMAQTFSEIIKAVASDREDSDRFGYAVDIAGNYAVVGAYGDDFGAVNPNMGSAYIFEKEGLGDWTFVQKISNSDQDDYDRFGWSVAIDSNYIIVGAYAEDHDDSDANNLSKAGSAYIFERNEAGVWNEISKLVPADRAAGDEFGWSVDISGTTAIVGAHFESHDLISENYIHHSGSVYIFNRSGDGTWVQSQKIIASDRSADITDPDGTTEDLSDQFGQAVAIDNNYLIVGAHQNDYATEGTSPLSQAGAAYVFERIDEVWVEVDKLVSSDRALNDKFGFTVAINGNNAVVGAPFEDDNNVGTETLTNAGSAYLFTRSGGSWVETQKISASDRAIGDRFGWDVAVHNDQIVIGASEANTDEDGAAALTDAGALYVFNYSVDGDTWNETSKIDASDRKAGDLFGSSVAIYENWILAGSYGQDFNAVGESELTNAGAVYWFGQFDCSPSSSSQTLTRCAGDDVIVGPYVHTESGTYTDVILSSSGCDSTVTTVLTVIPAPTHTQSVELCFGYTYTIGSSAYTTSGIYTDTISNAEGCDSIVTTNLTVSPENAITQEVDICWGESYSIGASTYYSPGIYTDVITSWSLCDCTITSIITQQLPVDRSISQHLNTLEAGAEEASYQWIKCSPFEVIEGATSKTYTAPEIGQYAVVVTEGSCTDTSSCVYVSVLGTETNELDLIQVYPNPSSGIFHIKLPKNIEIDATILNPLGKEIRSFKIKKPYHNLDLNNLTKGIYVLQLKYKHSVRTTRIILQ